MRRSQGYTLWLSPKALAPLTSYLRGIGVKIRKRTPPLSPIKALLSRYRDCLVGT